MIQAIHLELEISSYIESPGALIKWGWVACDERRKEDGDKFGHNAYQNPIFQSVV
jgi:hypothetical protein